MALAAQLNPVPQAPGRWPVVGHLHRYAGDAVGFLTELRREHGDLVGFQLGPVDAVLVSDPEAIEEVLIRDHRAYRKHAFLRDAVGEAFGEGLLTSDGDHWRKHRTLSQPAFRASQLAAYTGTMVRATERRLASWPEKGRVDVAGEIMELTLVIAAKTLFDVDLDEEVQAIEEALDAVMARFQARNRATVLLAGKLPTPGNLRYKRGVRALDEIVHGLIDRRREHEELGEDLLSRLLQAAQAQDVSLSDAELRDQLVTMLLAGHETTALTLTWTLHLLAHHPGVQARLQAELEAVLGQGPPTGEDLDELAYLDAVVTEAMRLYPPAWAIGREPIEDTDLLGHRLPQGTQLMMSQWVLHRDPRFYEDPEAFVPARWLDDTLTDKLPRFAYFPFGGGPRTCIGNTFALLEARLVLATIVQAYEVAPLGEMPTPAPSITLRPEGETGLRLWSRR